VHESSYPASLSWGLDHETHQAHGRTDHPHAQNGRAVDRQEKTVDEACQVIEETQPTYHCWRQQFGGMQAEEATRLTQLEKKNAWLWPRASPKEWKLLAEAELEKAMLKDLAEGKF